MGFILLILLFASPIIQIFLSAKRINGKIKMSLGFVAIVALILDIALPLLVSYIAAINQTFKPGEVRCITGIVAMFIAGSVLNIIASIIIGLISGLVYLNKHGRLTDERALK